VQSYTKILLVDGHEYTMLAPILHPTLVELVIDMVLCDGKRSVAFRRSHPSRRNILESVPPHPQGLRIWDVLSQPCLLHRRLLPFPERVGIYLLSIGRRM
jgi:hypothetical protein